MRLWTWKSTFFHRLCPLEHDEERQLLWDMAAFSCAPALYANIVVAPYQLYSGRHLAASDAMNKRMSKIEERLVDDKSRDMWCLEGPRAGGVALCLAGAGGITTIIDIIHGAGHHQRGGPWLTRSVVSRLDSWRSSLALNKEKTAPVPNFAGQEPEERTLD